jgi:hypothetical protein
MRNLWMVAQEEPNHRLFPYGELHSNLQMHRGLSPSNSQSKETTDSLAKIGAQDFSQSLNPPNSLFNDGWIVYWDRPSQPLQRSQFVHNQLVDDSSEHRRIVYQTTLIPRLGRCKPFILSSEWRLVKESGLQPVPRQFFVNLNMPLLRSLRLVGG